jgi:hypothetical protein
LVFALILLHRQKRGEIYKIRAGLGCNETQPCPYLMF